MLDRWRKMAQILFPNNASFNLKVTPMKRIFYTLIFSVLTFGLSAQTSEEAAAIMKPITQLFTGMNLGDIALVHRSFAKTVSMVSIGKDKEGKLRVTHENSIDGFLKAIATPKPEPLSEPIWEVKMNVDGNFATVWAQYALYVGKRFNHCGVDAFSLVKEADGQWRIFHLADTRRKEGCTVPESVSQLFK